MPFSAQKMFSVTTGTFSVGKHSLTTKLPNCFYQVDLITGDNWSVYPASTFTKEGTLRSSLHGGTQSCETTTVPTPPIVIPATLAKTGVSANAIIATVLATIVASTLAFRGYLVRKNA
jgi:hypothetical protein